MPAQMLRLLLGAWLAFLAGCTVQLAPSYDPALVEGLFHNNEQALVFFAKVENGSPATEFDTHEDQYAVLVGGFDALRERAASRYVPPLAARLADMRIVRELLR